MVKSLHLHPLIFLTLLWGSFGLQAQSPVIDSLKNIIARTNTTHGERIEAMGHLSRVLAADAERDFEEALSIAKEALQLSRKEEESKYAAFIQSTLGYLYVQQDSLHLAIQAMDSAGWYASRTVDKKTRGHVLFRQGWLDHIRGYDDKAYEKMLEALRILDGLEEHVYESTIYHYLAAIHGYWKEPEKQQYYSRLCVETALKSHDPDAIGNAYLSMGNSYLTRFRKDQSQRQLLDSSHYYNRRILELADLKKNRIIIRSTEGAAALNMANLYFEFYPPSYKDSAEAYIDRALSVGRETGHFEIIANSYGIMSEYALMEGDYGKAEKLLQMALTEISGNPQSGALVSSRIANALARVAEESGDAVKALDYYKQYLRYDKEFFDEEKVSMTRQLEAQYQSEKQKIALEAARQEAVLNKKLNRFYIILLVVGVLTLFFLFRSYHFKLKASLQRQQLLAGEKQEAELHASLKAEETARLQAERELMQERLDRLEKELLAGTLQVEEKNNLLQGLREKLASLDSNDPLYGQINRMIRQNQEIDKGYEDIKTEFEEIRPEFIATLRQKAEDKLTRLDLKYCSYILMGLTNKEIATKLNVDPKSIRMARYRIKQKLKLQKDDSLDQFIHTLGATS